MPHRNCRFVSITAYGDQLRSTSYALIWDVHKTFRPISRFPLDTHTVAATSVETMEKEAPTDAELVAETLAGDREAFGRLYDRYAALVRAVVGGVARDYAMVQDLAQESFLRAYRKLEQLRNPERFGAWIVGIARQVARERKRSLRRDRHQFVAGNCLEMESSADDLKAIGDAEEHDRVIEHLVTLPDREPLAIPAFLLQQRDARQAAELLDLSRSGFYALLKRALRRLTTRLCRGETQKETK